MVLADLGRKLNNALSALNKAPVVDEKVLSRHTRLTSSNGLNIDATSAKWLQVLDEILKEVCKALLESDVNVKLVQSLRNKVKAKVKASLEASEKDKAKSEAQRKSIVQKVHYLARDREYFTEQVVMCSRSLMNWWR